MTAAALITTAVFAGFMFMDKPIIQSMGFALAVAVIFDAFVVRMVLTPSLMCLMGEKAWYLPKWLNRIEPDVDIESESLHRPPPGRPLWCEERAARHERLIVEVNESGSATRLAQAPRRPS